MVIPPEGGYFIENGRRYGFYGAIGGAKENLPVELRHLSAARLVNGDENVTENITEVRGEKEKNDEWETVENSGILRNIDHIWEKHRDFWTYDELNEVFKNLDAKKRENELAGRDGIDRDESAIDTDEIERKAKELRIISDNDDVTSLPQGDGESASTSSSKLLSTADTNDQEMADAEKTVNRESARRREDEICHICSGAHEDSVLEDEGTHSWFRCDRCWCWYFEGCLQRVHPGEPENARRNGYWSCGICAKEVKQSRSESNEKFSSLERDLKKELDRLCIQKVSDIELSLADRISDSMDRRFDVMINQLSADIDTAVNSAVDRAGSSRLRMDDVDEQCNSLREQIKLDQAKHTREIDTANAEVQKLQRELSDANSIIKGHEKKSKTQRDTISKMQRTLDDALQAKQSMEKEIDRLKTELGKLHSERTRESWQSMTERDGAGAEMMDITDPERSHPRNRDSRKRDKDVSMRETLMEGIRQSLRQKAGISDRRHDEDRLRNPGSDRRQDEDRLRNPGSDRRQDEDRLRNPGSDRRQDEDRLRNPGSDRRQDEDRLRNPGSEQSSSGILRSKNQTDRNETSDTENARGRSATRPDDEARFIEVQRDRRKRSRSRARSIPSDKRVRLASRDDPKSKMKIGVISDSHMKFLMIDEQLEELWIRKGWDDSVYIFRGATAIELYKELPKLHHLENCDVIILSAGSNDIDISWQEQHDMKNDTDRENANKAVIRDIAEDIVNIGEYFTNKRKDVIWIGAPLRKNKAATGFLRLEEEVQRIHPKRMYSIATGQKMVDDLERTGNWAEGTAEWLDRDGVHLKKEAVRHVLLYIANKYETAELIEGAIPEARIRKEELFRGLCWACGRSGHSTRDCAEKDRLYCAICGNVRHNSDVCILQHRMCKYCGQKGPHRRKPCVGWWEKCWNWQCMPSNELHLLSASWIFENSYTYWARQGSFSGSE